MSKNTKFTVKQQRYVDCFDGNIKESAREAGISYQYAKELHTKTYYAHIRKAIQEREKLRRGEVIATREDRQKFWTKLMMGRATHEVVIGREKDGKPVLAALPVPIKEQIKASELLGRSEADFKDKGELEIPGLAALAAAMSDAGSGVIPSEDK